MIPALCRRYCVFLLLALAFVPLLLLAPETGRKALELTRDNLAEMLSFLPPIFVLLGLMDVWVERETMMKYMGEGSGIRGMLLAFLLGSAAAGPLYAAFPLACVMMKKGAAMLNIFLFIGAWSCTKIPLIMFETAAFFSSPFSCERRFRPGIPFPERTAVSSELPQKRTLRNHAVPACVPSRRMPIPSETRLRPAFPSGEMPSVLAGFPAPFSFLPRSRMNAV